MKERLHPGLATEIGEGAIALDDPDDELVATQIKPACFACEKAAAIMFNLEEEEIYLVERSREHCICPRQGRE